MKAPFPYFGGKSKVAGEIWSRFGRLKNYIEPFFGSGAVLLLAPEITPIETVNDLDGFVANFWRALQANPDEVAYYADWPVNENDLTARHIWLVNRKHDLQQKLEGDPYYYDAILAGWWVWGISSWIGSGWCSGKGPWQTKDGLLINLNGGVSRQLPRLSGAQGVNRQRMHLGDRGVGVNKALVHLMNPGRGVNKQLVHLGDVGRGVNRALVQLRNAGEGVHRKRVHLGGGYSSNSGINRITNNQCESSYAGLKSYMQELADRLRRVRVCCGDFQRVLGPSVTFKHGLTGVFLDPPYSTKADRSMGLYTTDSGDVANRARQWCLENGDNPLLRIALAGYESEHDDLQEHGWSVYSWKTAGGYAGQGGNASRGTANRDRERIWFSPHCLKGEKVECISTYTNPTLL